MMPTYDSTPATYPMPAMRGEAWQARAACLGADPELFFPPQGAAGRLQARAALDYCYGCPVRALCLDANLDSDHGVVGGMTSRQRRTMRAEFVKSGYPQHLSTAELQSTGQIADSIRAGIPLKKAKSAR